MSEKKRDNKKRILFQGESQDANGRYRYRYTDAYGNRHAIYSWRLTKADKTPNGKRHDLSLREKIQIINRDIADGIIANSMTVFELCERYVATKTGVKHNTYATYNTVLNTLKAEPFGQKQISHVKMTDAKLFLIKLQKEDHKGYSTIKTIRGVLKPAFQMAFDDDYIRKNPFDFQLVTVVYNDSVTREAITKKQEREFLRFVKEDKHFSRYYEGIYVLFKTGLRISEFVGLTVNDIDFREKTINVNHQLQRKRDGTLVIEPTKTNAGTRILPMTDDVCECFKQIIKKRNPPTVEPIIDGYAGFLFFDRKGTPMVAMHWEKYFQHICKKYNNIYKMQMPKVTPHVCRHTYCTNMAKAGTNPKTLQYLMGHSDISITLNTYTHLGLLDAKEELDRITSMELDVPTKNNRKVVNF